MLRGLQLVIVVFLSVLAVTTAASAAEWIVLKASQPAYYAHGDNTWKVVQRGSRIPVSSWIYTGKRGRVMLRRGADTIIVQPETMTGIGGTRNSGSRIAIRHEIGKVLLDIRKTGRPRVKVRTKHLTAVVKGTVFSVNSTKTESQVAVQRGLVAVTDIATGRSANVGAGQSVSSKGGLGASAIGSAPRETQSSAALSAPGKSRGGHAKGGNDSGDGGGKGRGAAGKADSNSGEKAGGNSGGKAASKGGDDGDDGQGEDGDGDDGQGDDSDD